MTMNRRDFLRMGGFLTVSTATVGLTGCFHDEDDETAGILTPEATGSNWAFPQSVASADPKPDSMILWTRVTPSGGAYVTGNTSANLSVRLVVSTDSANAAKLGEVGALLQGTAISNTLIPAYAKFDGTIRHKLTGLTANTVYYYQFVAGNIRTKIGRFKTAPAASVTPPQLKFAFMSCQDWNSNHWGAFQKIVSDDGANSAGIGASATPSLDFVVHLGDYIYETTEYSSGSVESKHGAQALPNGNTLNSVTHAATLADYRYLYKIYRSDTRIQSFHERFPIIAVWDDHEFSDDSYGNAETYTNANTKQSGRRQAANQAWFEFMPADIEPLSGDLSTFQTIKIYRDLKFGTLMHLVMTDERLYRSDHLIPETTDNPATTAVDELGRINSRYLAPETGLKSAEAQKSLLGTAIGDSLSLISVMGQTQRDWWKTTMSSSTATWKLWGNEVSLLRMGLDGTKALTTLLSVAMGQYLPLTAVAGDTNVAAAAAALQVASGSFSKFLTTSGTRDANREETATAFVTAALAIKATLGGGGTSTAAVTAAVTQLVTKSVTTGGSAKLSASDAAVIAAATLAVAAYSQSSAITTFAAATGITGTTNATSKAAAAAALTVKGTADGFVNLAGSTSLGNALQQQAAIITAALAIDTSLFPAAFADGVATFAEKTAAVTAAVTSLVTSAVTNGGIGAADAAAQAAFATTVTPAVKIAVGDYLTGIATAASPSSQALAIRAYFIGALAVSSFQQVFLLNADQWDGYAAERKNLMNHLRTNNIQNVVALTGDIHAFFAGQVYDNFPGEAKNVDGDPYNSLIPGETNPVMVDLVTAGISSTSWFSYLRDTVNSSSSLGGLAGLIYFKLIGTTTATAMGLSPNAAIGGLPGDTGLPFDVELPLLEFTLGKQYAPYTPGSNTGPLFTMIKDALKKQIATSVPRTGSTSGVPELAFEAIAGKTIDQIADTIAQSTALNTLSATIASLNSNPWLKHIDTDAQGYAVITLTSGTLDCKFHHLNQMLDLRDSALQTVFAPSIFPGAGTTPADTRPVISRTSTVTLTAGASMPTSLTVS